MDIFWKSVILYIAIMVMIEDLPDNLNPIILITAIVLLVVGWSQW